MDSKGTPAGTATLAGGLDLQRTVEEALEAWRGAGTGVTSSETTAMEIANLPTRFPETCLFLTGRTKGAEGTCGRFLCGEPEMRAAFGLEPDVPLLPFARGFVSLLAERVAVTLGASAEIQVDVEEGVRLTPEAVSGPRFAGATRAFQIAVAVGEGASLAGYFLIGPDDLAGTESAPARIALRAEGERDGSATRNVEGALPDSLNIIMDVELPLVVRLGEAEMTLEELLRLHPGSVIELNKQVNEPAELIVNNKVVAYGEVVVIHENFGVRISRLAHPASENIRLVT